MTKNIAKHSRKYYLEYFRYLGQLLALFSVYYGTGGVSFLPPPVQEYILVGKAESLSIEYIPDKEIQEGLHKV